MYKQIIFVIHTLGVGGAERQVAGMANHLSGNGCEVQIVLLDDARVCFPLDDRIKVICIQSGASKGKRRDFVNSLKLHTLRTVSPDRAAVFEQELFLKKNYVTPLHEYLSGFPQATVVSRMLVPNLVCMMALQGLPNRFIFTDAASPEYGLPEKHPQLQLRRKYIRRADAAVFQTPDERDYYNCVSQLEKHLIPNFLQAESLPEPYNGTRRKEVVTFCRLAPPKKISVLVDAFALFRRTFPEYTLGIYGEGGERKNIEEHIHALHMESCIRLYGEDLQVHEKVRDAAMFVSSSEREGISNSMLEAMAIGLPTVCTDCAGGGARMMIQDGVNGLLVPVNNPDALAAAMIRVTESESFAKQLSQNALRIREQLTLENIGWQWIEIL